jgi:hypothetical protein
MSQRFLQIEDLTSAEVASARTRSFVGNGSPFLMVASPEQAKLREVEAVRVGNQALSLICVRSYPVDAQMSLERVEEPMIEVQTRSDGAQFLARSVLSNDGIWPQGVPVFVTGEWELAPSDDAA